MSKHATMNRAFKLVWSKARGAYLVAPESAGTSSGRASALRKILPLLLLGLSGYVANAPAQVLPATTVVPVPGKTNAYLAGNGVPIVNINTANAAGVSHNQYTRYDVEAKGLVLNNGNNSVAARQSQLAGQVVSNLNLVSEARVIINEVVSANRSTLSGFTEVVGGKADVIVANPYGITCAGCGFINTDRVTLTTGVPGFAADGSLASLAVTRGDILINGAGINATAQQLLDIVTRSVRIEGQVNTAPGGELGITTGTNSWSYVTRAVTGSTAGADAVPTYAIDSTVLGGMYSGRIRLIATEAGVGVRMLGDAAASVNDFTLSSAGKVDIRSAVSAERDVQVGSTRAAAEALALTDARISAKRDISLTATAGSAALSGGFLVASGRLGLDVGSLTDTASVAAVTNNNVRFGQTTVLASSGATQLAATSWGAAGALSGAFGSFAIDPALGATAFAGTTLDLTSAGNMALTTGAIRAAGNISLVASGGQLSTAAGARQGIQTTAGNLLLEAGAGMANAGTAAADNGKLTVRVSGNAGNTGTLYAKGDLDIAKRSGGAAQNLSNSGTLLAGGALLLASAAIDNTASGAMQGTQGSTVSATSLNNDGLIVAANSAASDGTFNLASLVNGVDGVIQSTRDLFFNVSGSVGNRGVLVAGRDLGVAASDAGATLTVSNHAAGYVQAGRGLAIAGTGGGSNVSIGTQAGTLLGVGSVDLKIASLSNTGIVQSNAGMALTASGAVSNSNKVIAATTLDLGAGALINSGSVQAAQTLTVTATSLNNTGLINGTGAQYDTTLNLGTLANGLSGVIQSARDLTLNVNTRIDNSGVMQADRDQRILAGSAGTTLSVNNLADGYIGAASLLQVAGTAGGSNVSVDSQAGTLLADVLSIKALALSNSGFAQSSGANSVSPMTLDITNSLNNSGTLLANKGMALTAGTLGNTGLLVASTSGGSNGIFNVGTLNNSAGGTLQSARDLTLRVNTSLDNSGKILASGDLGTTAGSAALLGVANRAGAFMQAGGTLSFAGNSTLADGRNLSFGAQAGKLRGNEVRFTIKELGNSGVVQATGLMDLVASLGVVNSGTLLSGTTSRVLAGSVTNSGTGTLQATEGLTLTAASLANSGVIVASADAAHDGVITIDGILGNGAGGVIQSGRDLSLGAGTSIDNSGSLLADRDLTLKTAALNNQASGVVQAGGKLALSDAAGTGNVAIAAQQGKLLGNQVDIQATGLANIGRIQSDTTMTLALAQGLDNSGILFAPTSLLLTAGSVTNSGTIQSDAGALMGAGGLSLTAGSLTNSGTLIAANGLANGTINVDTLTNQAGGVLQSLGGGGAFGLNLNVKTALDNSGTVIAESNLGVQARDGGTRLQVTNLNGGLIQAGNQLRLGTAGSVDLSNQANARIIGFDAKLTAGTFGNAGRVQGTSLELGADNLTNDGVLSATRGLKANVTTSLTNTATGVIQSDFASTLTVSTFNNGGKAILSSGGEYATLNVGEFTNAAGAAFESKGHMEVNASRKVDNSGTIRAGGQLALNSAAPAGQTADILNRAGAVMQADLYDLYLGQYYDFRTSTAHEATMSVQAGKLIAGGGFVLSFADLTNTGVIQGGTPGSNHSAIRLTGDLTNDTAGLIVFASTANGEDWIGANNIVNRGKMESAGDLKIFLGNSIDNSGSIVIDGRLKVTDKDNSDAAGKYAVTNTGRIDTGGELWLRGLQGLDVETTATWVGGSMNIAAPAVALKAGAMLSTLGDFTLDANSMTFADPASRIVAATSGSGTATITLGTAFTNKGAVHSGGNLTFTAPGITNSGTGGFSALNDLTLNANAAAGFTNSGALYAGNDLGVTTTGTLTNFLGSIVTPIPTFPFVSVQSVAGTIDAGRDITLSAATFVNNNSIDAGRNISITAATFRNETTGGDTRVKGAATNASAAAINNARTVTVYSPGSSTPDYYNYFNETTYNATLAFPGATVALPNGVVPTKPTITGNGTLAIKGFGQAFNTGGVIASPTVTISSTTTGASFVNNPLLVGTGRFMDTQVLKCLAAFCAAGFETPTVEAPINNVLIGNGTAESIPSAVFPFIPTVVTPPPLAGIGAGIFATTLTATGFSLTNSGSPAAAAVDAVTRTGLGRAARSGLAGAIAAATGTGDAAGGSTVGGVSAAAKVAGAAAASGTAGATPAAVTARLAANKAAGITGTTTASGAPAIAFGGLTIALPSNPNGFFVLNKSPSAAYLVETNPLFSVGSNFVGSNYLAQRYGYNPDVSVKRLGDSNYEAYLIKQQLTSQTGNTLLAGFRNEAAQMQGLMDNALAQAKNLGLTYGLAPSPDQLKNLKSDMVWMVETMVGGQRVLTPVVYLAADTRAAIDRGGVIAGDNVSMNLTSVSNTGGTIAGRKTLDITSKGDVTNTGGTIRGGDVSVVSTEGSIVNRTTAVTTGNAQSASTVIGKTGTIELTGNLVLDAKKDITVQGGQVSAGGDAKLKAGNNITFDTIEDRTTTTTSETTKSRNRTTTETTTTTEVRQVKSGLTVGGNLSSSSGNDTTIAGSDVTVGGSASIRAGGNLNVIDRENTTTSTTQTTSKGTGTFSSLRGSSSSTTDTEQVRSAGSSIKVGGDANLEAGRTTTIKGSDVSVAGSARIAGQDVQIVEGRNTDTSTTTTDKKSVMKSTGSGVAFSESTRTTTENFKSTAVGSNVGAGKSLLIDSGNDVTVRGSNLTAGQDVVVKGTNVNVQAAENIETSRTTTTSKSTGMFFGSDNQAKASGGASGTGSGDLQGRAGAEGSASSKNTMDVARQTTTTTDTLDVTNTGSRIGGGGVVVIKAQETVKVQGSDLSGDGGVSVRGKNVEFTAAQDIHTTTTTTDTKSAGLYLDGTAKASGTAQGGAGGAGGGAVVQGQGEAKVSAGVQVRATSETTREGTSTARVSTITSKSGDIERVADQRILDVGTAIDAGGNFVQKATTIDSRAASNTSFSTTETTDKTLRVGGFAGADAKGKEGAFAGKGQEAGTAKQFLVDTAGSGGSADAVDFARKGTGGSDLAKEKATPGSSAGAGGTAGGGRGAEIRATSNSTSTARDSSTAVVSTVKAGGGISSTSTGKTTLEGTQFESKGDVNIGAAELDFRAARDTQSSSSSETGVMVGVEASKKEAKVEGSRDTSRESSSGSQALAGGVTAGGRVNISTSGDTRLEGTTVKAGGDASVAAGGNLKVEAARDESSFSKRSDSVSASVEGGKGEKGGKSEKGGAVAASTSRAEAETSTATGATIQSGGTVSLSAGKDASLEGTNVGGKDATLKAGGKAEVKSAESTSSQSQLDAGIDLAAKKGGGKDGKEGSQAFGSANLNAGSTSDSTEVMGRVDAGPKGLQIEQGGAR